MATAVQIAWPVMATITQQEFVKKHLENLIAAEQTFEDLLSRLSGEGQEEEVKNLFRDLSKKARTQHQRLTTRLKELGGTPSTLKSVTAHFLGFSPLIAQSTQSPQEKDTQNLIMCYAAAASEVAMYEAMARTAKAAGDARTEELSRQLQEEERQDHELAWNMLGPSAQRSFHSVAT